MPEDIVCVEPVFPSVESDESAFVECTIEWDDNRDCYVNYESEEEWILDEHAFADASYRVNGTEFTSLDEAKVAAGAPADATVLHDYEM